MPGWKEKQKNFRYEEGERDVESEEERERVGDPDGLLRV